MRKNFSKPISIRYCEKQIISLILTFVILCTFVQTISYANENYTLDGHESSYAEIQLMAMGDYGGNLTGATWYWPIHGYSSTTSAYSKITSSYGYRGGSFKAYHKGVDIGEANGTSVYSIRSGTVSVVDNNPSGSEGRSIIINHNDGYYSVYMHLSSINVSQGQSVNATTKIGAVGGSGFGSETGYAYHLHLGIHYGSSFNWECNVNPCPSGYTRIGDSLQASAGGYSIGSASISYSINPSSSTSKPEAISIKTNLYNNKMDNPVKFDFEYKNAEWAAVVIRKDGINKHVETVTGKNTYSHKFAEPGRYDIHLELWKGDDCSTKAINGGINVYASRPSNVTITPNKTHIIKGEKIDFSFTQKDASYWYFIVTKDGIRECVELMTGKYSAAYTFTDEGVFEVQIQTANDYGWTNVPVYITVSDEYTPTTAIEWNGHIYSLYDYSVSWEEAKELCEEFGGHLATINSDEECEFIFSLVEQGENTRYFLGGTDVNNEGNWEWITAEEWLIDDCWNSGEPNNDGSAEHYLETRVNGWNDVPKSFEYSHGFIFERERPSNVQDLTPTATAEYNGHTYLLFDYSLTWHDAKRVCEELGGHLATATTEEEYNMLLDIVLKGTKDDYFLGGTDEKEEGTWQWITAEEWEYEGFWRSGEPNNYLGEEHYLKIDNAGVDAANKSLTYRGFICEIEGAYTKSTVTKSGAKLIIDTKVHNIAAPYNIVIVGYKDNEFITMKRVANNEQNSPSTLVGDIDKIKVMVWNGLSSIKPLCDAEEIPRSKWIIE